MFSNFPKYNQLILFYYQTFLKISETAKAGGGHSQVGRDGRLPKHTVVRTL